MSEKYPTRKIAIVKYAIGGMCLCDFFLPPSAGGPGEGYTGIVTTMDNALATLDPEYTPVLAGFLWAQGEASGDGQDGPDLYKARFEALIEDLRAEYNAPGMKAIFAGLQTSRSDRDLINQAIIDLMDTQPLLHTFGSDDLPEKGDHHTHYNWEGMLGMGYRYASRMIYMEDGWPSTTTAIVDVSTTTGDGVVYGGDDMLGTISGISRDTETSNNVYQSYTEVVAGSGNPSLKYSALNQVWALSPIGGETVTLYVEAHHTVNIENEHFDFEYSLDNGNTFNYMFTVTKTTDDDNEQSFELPPGTSGILNHGILIRAMDTDRTQGNQDLATLYVDKMYMVSSGGAGPVCGDANCDPGEDECNCSSDCGPPPSSETNCSDGVDEDCDTFTDCDDNDCLGDPACPSCGDATCDPGEDQCNCPADCGSPPATETNCTDGIDEDCDGDADCNDPTGDCDLDPACDCLGSGASCSDDSECCSNRCRGGKCRG
jgi:hypothetical protein